MRTDDEAARKARAERLREEIDRITHREGEHKASEPGKRAPKPKSPRDLIHDKMRELDESSNA